MLKSIAALFILFSCFSCSKTIYIVRHAEKVTTVKDNPPLTEDGKQRAAALATVLKNEKITTVYSTNTLRTINTAKPFADANALIINIYRPDTVQNVLQAIVQSKKNALIVGHSNTILPMLTKMGITPPKTDVPDWEYDNLFKVKYKRYCKDCKNPFVIKKVTYKKYGVLSKTVLAEPSHKMK